MRVVANLAAAPGRRMSAEPRLQAGTAIVRPTGLCDLRTLGAYGRFAFVRGSYDSDVTRLVVVVIAVGRNHQPTLVRLRLRGNRAGHWVGTERPPRLSDLALHGELSRSSLRSQVRAIVQSRLTVAAEMPRARAVSSIDKPPK